MNSILERLIQEDFGYNTRESSKYGKGVEHDSLVLNKDRNIFYWNSMGIWGNAIDYLVKVRKLSFQDAKKIIENYDKISGIQIVKNEKHQDVIVSPKLVDVFFDNGLLDRDYFYQRGLNDSIINRFRLGKYLDFYTVPFFENSKFKNFQLRKDNPKTSLSYYKYIGPLLFNSDILKIVDRVYYAEGPVDAMILIQNGLPAVSSNCAGGYLTSWYSRFNSVKDIILLFDNDDAGTQESKRLSKFLGETKCKIYNFWDFDGKGYDPVDFFRDGHTISELKELINSKFKYGFQL